MHGLRLYLVDMECADRWAWDMIVNATICWVGSQTQKLPFLSRILVNSNASPIDQGWSRRICKQFVQNNYPNFWFLGLDIFIYNPRDKGHGIHLPRCTKDLTPIHGFNSGAPHGCFSADKAGWLRRKPPTKRLPFFKPQRHAGPSRLAKGFCWSLLRMSFLFGDVKLQILDVMGFLLRSISTSLSSKLYNVICRYIYVSYI